jgi:hypothetical protein
MLPEHLEHLQRWPTTTARKALSRRFGIPLDQYSQDWEWEVADATRFDEFLAAYHDPSLSDDERVSLIEILIQCVENLCTERINVAEVEHLPAWKAVAAVFV